MPRRHNLSLHHAFTVLEIILALAILAGSLAALGEVIRVANQQSVEARELTEAQLLAASKMAEITSGFAAAESVDPTQLESDPDWTYSVGIETIPDSALLAVKVTVTQNLNEAQSPISFSLVCWLTDPSLAVPDETTQ